MPSLYKSDFQPVPETTSADSQNKTDTSICSEIWHAAKDLVQTATYTAVAEPVLGVVQLSDKAVGAHNFESLQTGLAAIGLAPPEKATGAIDRHAQMLGSALGMVVPYMLLHKGISAGSAKVFSEESFATRMALSSTESKVFGSMAFKHARLAFGTGFTYDAVFRPSDNTSSSFVIDRLTHALTGGTVMATLSATAFGLSNLAERTVIKSDLVKNALANPVASGALSAIPAGIVQSEANALKSGKLLPTASEIGDNIYQMGIVGAALGGAHVIGGKASAERVVTEPNKESKSSNDSATAEKSEPLKQPAPIEPTERLKSGALSNLETPLQRAERLNLPKDFEQSKDLFFGQVENGDGTTTDVVVRPFTEDLNTKMRVYRAEVSNKVNETVKNQNGVDSPALPLVRRENVTMPGGEGPALIQENGGKQLGSQLREWAQQKHSGKGEMPSGSITKLIDENTEVRELMGRAAFDNMFKGNVDLVEFSQQTIKEGKAGEKLEPSGQSKLVAVDNKNDFTLLEKPSWGFGSQFGLSLEVAKALEGKKLSDVSPKLQSEAEATLKVFSSEEGRNQLLADGLTLAEIDAAKSRLTSLINDGFPKHLGENNFYADAAEQELTASFTGAYDDEAAAVRDYLKSRDENRFN
ncbi:MAG: hypothetical protein JST89_22350 [Cyanobacteria bacterium SZAS-4]|nr:hypothetical protein [Cyanobacteria bacterium SZAS-4]